MDFYHELIKPTHYGHKNKFDGYESTLQAHCFQNLKRLPDRPLVVHTPNERKTATRINPKTGKRYSPRGNRLKAQGVTPGFPDITVYQARGKYLGLAVEVKTKGDNLRPEQKYLLDWLAREGWYIAVVWSKEGLKELSNYYWSLPKTYAHAS